MRPPDNWKGARVTLVIAGVTAAAWILASITGVENYVTIWGGFIPARASVTVDAVLAPFFLTPLTATLIHIGFLHLAFNLLMFLFCARSVEPIVNGKGLVLLYVVGAYAAAGAHWATSPQSITPVIGASGAISAVLGAYAMFFGRQRLKIANPALGLLVNALWLAAAWTAFQLLIGLTIPQGEVMPAIAGHIGGFIAGLLIARPLLLLRWRGA